MKTSSSVWAIINVLVDVMKQISKEVLTSLYERVIHKQHEVVRICMCMHMWQNPCVSVSVRLKFAIGDGQVDLMSVSSKGHTFESRNETVIFGGR